MKNKIRNLLPLLVAGFLYSCGEGKTSLFEPYEGPVLVSHNIESVLTDSAHVEFIMRAPKQIRYQSNDEEFPEGLYMEFHNDEHQKETVLVAKYAYFTKKHNQWTFKDSVRVKDYIQNRLLATDELNWEPDDERIYTDKKVEITTGNQLLKGTGLEAKSDFSDWEILNPTGVEFLGDD
ncbi:MAG: LPS export ABC transporter periplasmic protein LptC [Cytophagales bacterium]|nr:LPS export ABC transporter periplasmic protein LptC [Cytophagales bacterium]